LLICAGSAITSLTVCAPVRWGQALNRWQICHLLTLCRSARVWGQAVLSVFDKTGSPSIRARVGTSRSPLRLSWFRCPLPVRRRARRVGSRRGRGCLRALYPQQRRVTRRRRAASLEVVVDKCRSRGYRPPAALERRHKGANSRHRAWRGFQ